MKKAALFHALVGIFLAAAASPAWACSVCFGKADSPIVKGVELSVIFMVGVTYTVITGGFASFFLLRLRARRKMLAEGAAGGEG